MAELRCDFDSINGCPEGGLILAIQADLGKGVNSLFEREPNDFMRDQVLEGVLSS